MITPRKMWIFLVLIALSGIAQAYEPSLCTVKFQTVLTQFGVPFSDFPSHEISSLSPFYQNLVTHIARVNAEGELPLALCFAEDTDPEIVRIVNAAIYGDANALDYVAGTRWGSTATNSSTGGQGDPITITYSFVPDGVTIPNGAGEGAAPNELHARMNALFGSPAVWKAKFAQVFSRWNDLCGINYIEVGDDGAPLFTSPGVVGQRGDVRISMKNIDGGSGVLAYNYFPNTGDMVLDRSENWASSVNDFRFMRNIIAHEHGHGMGLRHVCPIDHSKLMQPYLSTAFDGPRHDDLRGSQRHYGDTYENNNTAATATNLGTISGLYVVPNASCDDNSDVDFYRFTVGSGQQVTITLDILGQTYLDGAQNSDGSCSAGSQINTLDDQNLSVRLLDPTGLIVLAEAASQPAGVDEVIPVTPLPAAGSYFVQVLSGSNDVIQLYELRISVSAGAGPILTVGCPNGGETVVTGAPHTIEWTSANLSGNVRIELNRAFPTGSWETIVSSTANDGAEVWTPSNAAGSACRIRITGVSEPAACDTSNANFVLLSLVAPDDVVIVVEGSNVVLHWTGTAAPLYKVYSAANSSGPFTTHEGTTTAPFFTDVNGAAGSEMRFYHVVAAANP